MAAAVLVSIPAAGAAPRSTGLASWYGAWHAGRVMANGCRFDPARLTAASRTLPLGARARVRNLHNDLSVIVTITDRGPYHHPGRIIDLSLAAARALGAVQAGVVPVEIEILSRQPVRGCH